MNKTRICSLAIILPLTIYSGSIPFPEPGHEGLNVKRLGTFGEFDIGLWLQYRVMYNKSNIPGPGGTTFLDNTNYDFFRQRFRIGFDIQSAGKMGVYTQLEYRGGWGGSSPAVSDARGSAPVNNPYNRLQPRGIRYGFIYYALNEKLNLSAGIIPLTDGVGRILFDADWDFNVGGIVLGGRLTKGNYRLGYVRMVEGVGGTEDQIDKDGDLIIADYYFYLNKNFTLGSHFYNLTVPSPLNVITSKAETWYGLTTQGNFNRTDFSGMILLNRGNIESKTHNGIALKLEGSFPLGKVQASILAITTTGDEEGEIDKRFVTPHQLFSTSGFWGYSHIFNANGPSDVNDLGLEIGNSGAGLSSLQIKVDIPLSNKVGGQLVGGWFQAGKERNSHKDMGTELGGMLTYKVAKYLNWELGASIASIGDFYAPNSENLTEIYSRFQFTW